MTAIEDRLKKEGFTLPDAIAPVADYVPFSISGKLVFISGQICLGPDGLITGKLGDDISIEDGKNAARICGLNLLAQLKSACDGDLSRVARCIRLGGFVNCTPDFVDQPEVINGASHIMVLAFGDSGRHSRVAVGAPSLPLEAAVEVDAIFELQ